MNLQVIAQVGTLGKQNQMRQRKLTAHNLLRRLFVDIEISLSITHHSCPGRKMTLAVKSQ
jgi:hypothetical protein